MTIWRAFFAQDCREAIAGRSDAEALGILRDKIADAEIAKLEGGGPPLDEINQVRRLGEQIFNRWIAERLPSTVRRNAA